MFRKEKLEDDNYPYELCLNSIDVNTKHTCTLAVTADIHDVNGNILPGWIDDLFTTDFKDESYFCKASIQKCDWY